jgi:GTPase SAR1 family protein
VGSGCLGSCSEMPVVPPATVFLGDQGVGKTSIITRFMYDTFEKTYQVGVASASRPVRPFHAEA